MGNKFPVLKKVAIFAVISAVACAAISYAVSSVWPDTPIANDLSMITRILWAAISLFGIMLYNIRPDELLKKQSESNQPKSRLHLLGFALCGIATAWLFASYAMLNLGGDDHTLEGFVLAVFVVLLGIGALLIFYNRTRFLIKNLNLRDKSDR